MMRVYLVGFMGAGKSTVGRLVASALDLPFVDLDREVEASAGSPVSEIFAERGEAEFRDLESAALDATVERQACVVATGGGVLGRRANRETIRRAGRSIWLDPPFEVILSRLDDAARDRRPLFADPEAARGLWERRRDDYRKCEIRIAVAESDAATGVATEVLRQLGVE